MKALIASAVALGLIAGPAAATTAAKPTAAGSHKVHKTAKKTTSKKNDASTDKKTS